ncbi:unnamed protein product, partial [Prorocentrum cordatum]
CIRIPRHGEVVRRGVGRRGVPIRQTCGTRCPGHVSGRSRGDREQGVGRGGAGGHRGRAGELGLVHAPPGGDGADIAGQVPAVRGFPEALPQETGERELVWDTPDDGFWGQSK